MSKPETEKSATESSFLSAESYDDIGEGTRTIFSKTFTDSDVEKFAVVSGDSNPLHLDSEYASETRFDERIAHGALVSSTVSAALSRLPGIVIYMTQTSEFRAPVYIGETVTATCEIVENLGNNQYRIKTVVENEDGVVVVDGEAEVLIEEETG